MKEVKKCSLSGIAFTFEREACDELSSYLETLRRQYAGQPEGDEIVADIEARIAELILSTQDNVRPVEVPLVRNIIAQMGSAEQIDAESGADEEAARSGSTPGGRPEGPRIPRRLYRDTERARLGGVLAGLGKYFDCDPVWLRIGIFAPLLLAVLQWVPWMGWLDEAAESLFGFFALSYLVLWFVVPPARTARQKLEQNGEPITLRSIEQRAAAAPNDVDGRAKTLVADAVSLFGRLVLILLKIVAMAVLFAIILTACGLIIGLFAVGFDNGGGVLDLGGEALVPVLGIVAVLIPCLLLIYVLLCLIASQRPSGRAVLATVMLWLASIVCVGVAAVRAPHIGPKVQQLRQLSTLLRDASDDDPAADSLRGQLPDSASVEILLGEKVKIQAYMQRSEGE